MGAHVGDLGSMSGFFLNLSSPPLPLFCLLLRLFFLEMVSHQVWTLSVSSRDPSSSHTYPGPSAGVTDTYCYTTFYGHARDLNSGASYARQALY